MSTSYNQTLDFLYSSLPEFQQVGSSAYKPGLERVREFNSYLGAPDRNFLSVHVAGTNGKGSVSHTLASVLTMAGYRVGLYTLPHLIDFRERIRVDGEPISQQQVVDFVEQHRPKMLELGLSFFEMTVAMAFDHFSKSGAEIAVVEVGLGGRLDATNIITPILSVITNISLDHTALLGNTVAEIAAEKAGIIKSGVPVVVGEWLQASSKVFEQRALQEGSDLIFAEQEFAILENDYRGDYQHFALRRERDGSCFDVDIDLMGDCQSHNIITIFVALDTLHRYTPICISRRAAIEGCAVVASSTGLRGRWEVLGREPLIVCDTGHNEAGIETVARQISRQSYNRLFMVIGFVDDKDLSHILPLLPSDAHYIFTQSSVRRALSAQILAGLAADVGLRGEVMATVSEAVVRAQELASAGDMIFIGGSTFTVADALMAHLHRQTEL